MPCFGSLSACRATGPRPHGPAARPRPGGSSKSWRSTGQVELAAYVDAEGERALRRSVSRRTGDGRGAWVGGRLAAFPPAGRGGWCVDRAAVGASAAGHSGGADRAGTGVRDRAHPTTRLCIEHLARLEPGSLLDVGCGPAWWRWQLGDWGTSRLRRSTSTPSPSNAHGTTPLATTFRSTWPSWTPSSTSCRRHALPWSTSFVPRSRACSRVSTWPSPSRPATSPPRHRPRPAGARLARLERVMGGRRPCASASRSAPSSASRSVATFSARFLGCGVVCGCAGDS